MSPDVMAEVISAAVMQRTDMTLVHGRTVAAAEVPLALQSIPSSQECALIVVGYHGNTEAPAEEWLADRPKLVVLCLDIVDDIIKFAFGDIGLEPLLWALKDLVDRVNDERRERVRHFQMRPVSGDSASNTPPVVRERPDRPLLGAAVNWIHAALRNAVEQLSRDSGDLPGLTVTVATVAKLLDPRIESDEMGSAFEVEGADAALTRALTAADPQAEPLAAAVRALGLTDIEFRILLLALAPELDARYQRCFGLLLDDLSRRVGTLGLCVTLLGAPAQIRCDLAQAGNLARWRLLESRTGELPPADEPLRLDPPIAEWLLGNPDALDADMRTRHAMQPVAWPGAALLERQQERANAAGLIARLQGTGEAQWVLLGGHDGAGWRALLELGGKLAQSPPLRVEPARLAAVDLVEIEECALRVGRMARLTGRPLVIDITGADDTAQEDDGIRAFLAAVSATGRRGALICTDAARSVGLLGAASFDIEDAAPLAAARVCAAGAAAGGADLVVTQETAHSIANQYPLQVDGFERAMRLACGRPLPARVEDPGYQRFTTACQQVAAEGLSRLAERIEPVFKLDSVILPPDRTQQLSEIVDSIRLGPKVLDGWKFREHLPYGRGVTALFHGPSGTGKTMAAMGVARSLDIQILRLDFSRVVSKYIGDTEKNIDRVFNDAQRSGCAILIDEADALLGKRSEVKDAHDRYANIEVAYLLQRMEAYEGLAILTTNLRQNLDAAFLRRLRFIVDFPRPDAAAREEIWRRCLPAASHALAPAAFRLLSRKIELTGGHIRQITLRAAFLAAAADQLIGFEHIVYATNAEFAKLGMPALEFAPLAERRAA
nr:ATP-binding protein [uncultured Duganella sp.]